MNTKTLICEVTHEYEREEYDIAKFIGVFSSEKKAIDAVEKLMNKPGFKDHPQECFVIDKTALNRIEWTEGFVII